MSLIIGTRLGPYEIVSTLGAGGMGEVYRARDTKLNRDVAIKVLLPGVANDPDRLARFSREAQVLASLNHPNIAQIHGLEESNGVTALVMELVEGEDLSQRIARGAIPIDEALPIARQIAEALEAAHDHGIIHRDLKPANVKVRPDGTVKVLDFGLAKQGSGIGDQGSGGAANSPTLSIHATEAGIILGTAAYMSPEQAAGKAVDKRSDLWAFGVVLLEMLTGRQTFAGETVSHVLAAVLKDEPDWTTLPPDTQASIRRLLRRCLEKDRKRRLPDAAIARLEIDDALSSSSERGEPDATDSGKAPSNKRAPIAWWVAAVFALTAAALGAAMALRPAPPDPIAFRSTLLVTESLTGRPPAQRFALSPDGRLLAYAGAEGSGGPSLWIRPLAGSEGRRLPGTEGASSPFWSPDSRFVGFNAGGKLKKVDAMGGTPVTIADASVDFDGRGSSATWNRDDVIVYTAPDFSSLVQVTAAGGGTPTAVTTLDSSAGETDHTYPFFLPDGRHFLYVASSGVLPLGVYVGSLVGRPPVRLLEGVSNAQYASGSLFFVRGTTLMVQPFNATTLAFSGEAEPLGEHIQTSTVRQRGTAFSVSTAGSAALVYQSGVTGSNGHIAWVDRAGKQTAVLSELAPYRDLWLSPDDATASVSIFDATRGGNDIWMVDVVRGLRTRFTFDPADEFAGIFSQDGAEVIFNSGRNGHLDLYRKATGGGVEDVLLRDRFEKRPTDWSVDGQHLLYMAADATTQSDLWVLPLSGTRTPFPFAATPFDEQWGQFSPDNRWIAYTSTESGRREVYAAPFPGPGGKKQISVAGGNYPRWRGDGKELFYHSPDNKMMAAAVRSDTVRMDVDTTRPLFDMRAPSGGSRVFYDVSGDGQRFLLSIAVGEASATPLTLVTNWPALLKKGK